MITLLINKIYKIKLLLQLMKKEGKNLFLGFFLMIILVCNIVFVSAVFEIGNISHSISKQYSPSGLIQGWVNISFSEEPKNSMFKTSNDNEISLIELLNKSPSFSYSCTPSDCGIIYSSSNSETIKTFNLNSGESKIFGFKFTGNVAGINSVKFEVQSDAPPSCSNQLKIDFLNDGIIESGNNKIFNQGCSSLKRYGCFIDNSNTEEYSIGAIPFCQKIRLSESPGFKIGAWTKKINGNKNLTMALYDDYGAEKTNCELPDSSSQGGEVSCEIDYLVTESKDYYICIYSDSGNGDYRIKGYSLDSEIGCGFYGTPIQSDYPAAYQIFAEGKKFDSFGTLEINNSMPDGNLLNSLMENYLIEKYGNGIDCSNDCIIPVKFISGENQTITINNLDLKYQKNIGPTSTNLFYDIEENPANINADFQKLFLDDANFSVPSDYGNKSFKLFLNNEQIFSENIFIEKMPVINFLRPTTIAAAYPTKFIVDVSQSNSNVSIINYEWDFGNNDTKKTDTNTITYTYDNTGEYNIKITVTDSKQLTTSKTFNVVVETPIRAVNTTLKSKLEDLDNVKNQINTFPLFYKNSLEPVIKIEESEEKIKQIQKDYKSAISDEDYIQIMKDLLEVDVPKSVFISKSAESILFYPNRQKINLEILKEIGGGNYESSNEEKYIDAVYAWEQENIESKITFTEISAKYEENTNEILNVFELNIKEKEELPYNAFIIIETIENLKFQTDYGENLASGYIEIPLREQEKTIMFSTTKNIDFSELPLFISPELNRLSILDEGSYGEAEKPKWLILILILIFLIILGLIIYIILQEWYKRKYENYLFKNRNNLYNLVTYIKNSKSKGMQDDEIISNLKKSGWNSEQVTYVTKKYLGKRTGMYEIPIGKLMDLFKKKGVIKPGNNQNLPPKKGFLPQDKKMNKRKF